MVITVEKMAGLTGGRWVGMAPAKVNGFAFDARRVRLGECFIALSSGERDGHDFAGQAKENGASCMLVERKLDVTLPQLIVEDTLHAMGDLGHASRSVFSGKGPVIAVTGSCGKTSSKEMLKCTLGEEVTHATAGNWNNRIGVPMTLFDLDSEKHTAAIIEAGINQPGEMDALGEMIEADFVLMTNIGPAHLELLKSLEGIAEEKSRLVKHARREAPVLLTADSFRYPVFKQYAERAIVLVRSGEDTETLGDCHKLVYFELEPIDKKRTRLTIVDERERKEFVVNSPSEGIATNAALVVVLARLLGLNDGVIERRLSVWQADEQRGALVEAGERQFYVDCYNANPASMKDALAAFVRRFDEEIPRCYVLGAMNELGDESEALHTDLGTHVIFREQDCIFLIGPDRLTKAFKDGLLKSGWPTERIFAANSVDLIREQIEKFAGLVFLKGSRSYALETLLPKKV